MGDVSLPAPRIHPHSLAMTREPPLEAPFSPGASLVLRMKTTLQDELLGPRAAAGVQLHRRARDWQSSHQAILADSHACQKSPYHA